MLPQILTDAPTELRVLATANRQPVKLALTIATFLLATSGCVALSIPSKRFHDPEDHGGLFGDYRKGGSGGMPGNHADHAGHFHDGNEAREQCTEGCCSDGHHLEFDDELEMDSHDHQKAPEVPWPRYHPVPTRPVFSGFPGVQQ